MILGMSDNWLSLKDEGQLSVDVFRRGDALVIRATMAGVKLEDVDIGLDGDLLTVRGKRIQEVTEQVEDWFYKECYWGTFSRSIILPVDVYAERAEATLKDGVLEIHIPIREANRLIPIRLGKK